MATVDTGPSAWYSLGMFHKSIGQKLVIQNAEMHHAAAMASVQRRVFPTLSANELIGEEHFSRHIELFPEGQFVVLLDGTVIASTSTFRTSFPNAHHTFLGITGDLWLTTHDPVGQWMYGFDMGVDPEFQGLGLGRIMYRARNDMALRLGMKGQVIVGMPSGFGKVSSQMTFPDYLEGVKTHSIFDPTVSVQIKMGFKPLHIIPDYLVDPKCGNYGVMMTLGVETLIPESSQTKGSVVDRIGVALTRLQELRAESTPVATVQSATASPASL
jgi:GNAT superfamily N-acetyltransferase